MPHYRCFFLDGSGKIRDVAFIDRASNELAKDRACELLMQSKHPIAELWLLDQRIYQATKYEATLE
jgi:hypothetical protein